MAAPNRKKTPLLESLSSESSLTAFPIPDSGIQTVCCADLAELASFLERNHAGGGFLDSFLKQRGFSFGFQYSAELNGRRLFLDGNLHFVIDDKRFKDCFSSADAGLPAEITFASTTESARSAQPIWMNS